MTDVPQIADTSQLAQVLRTPTEVIRAAPFESDSSIPPALADRCLNIGLIDCHRFSQDCLIKAFDGLDPRPSIVPFEKVQDCISSIHTELDVVVYYSHSTDGPAQTTLEEVIAVRQAFKTAPIIVLSDAEDAEHPNMVRSILNYGAQGFIPTRTTGIPIAFAAIRFITAGGVFAPLDLLLTKRPDSILEAGRRSQLTPRQYAVLNQLQQGKANKIIAHELGMSESTRKDSCTQYHAKDGCDEQDAGRLQGAKALGQSGNDRPGQRRRPLKWRASMFGAEFGLRRFLVSQYLRGSTELTNRMLRGRSGAREFGRVVIVSALGRNTGIASGARLQWRALKRLGVDVELVDASPALRNPWVRVPHRPGSAYVFHSAGPQTACLIRSVLPHAAAAHRVGVLGVGTA